MKRIIIALTLLSFVLQMNAQSTIEGIVIDSETKTRIQFVNIGIIKLSQGTLSDIEGKYTMNFSSNDDVVMFSSIGYETLNIKVKDLKNNDTIEMVSKEYEMQLVEIAAKRFEQEEIILGVKNSKKGHSIGFGSAQLGAEIGSMIEVKNTTYIQSANFELNHARGDSLLFRINMYDLSGEEIGKKLLTENIIIKEKQRKGTITVDLKDYNIILNSDVLLTLEWLRDFDEIGNKEITFNTKKSKRLRGTFIKYSSNGDFVKLSHKTKLKPCFYLIGKQSK
jgi:hypothetical protein